MRQFLALLLIVIASAPSIASPMSSASSTPTPAQILQDPCPNC